MSPYGPLKSIKLTPCSLLHGEKGSTLKGCQFHGLPENLGWNTLRAEIRNTLCAKLFTDPCLYLLKGHPTDLSKLNPKIMFSVTSRTHRKIVPYHIS